MLLTYWNTVAFHTLYARAAGWQPGADVPLDQRHVLDRWLVSQRETLTRKVTEALENFDTQTAGALLATFIDDMSNWYVRRSRRRFWDGDVSALTTLHETLDTLTRLLAPMTPFVTEQVWQDVVVATDAGAPNSVHLASWPQADDVGHRRRPRRRHAPGSSSHGVGPVGAGGGEGQDTSTTAADPGSHQRSQQADSRDW